MLLLIFCVSIIVKFILVRPVTIVLSVFGGLLPSLFCFLNLGDKGFFVFSVWLAEVVFSDRFAHKNNGVAMTITNVAILGLLPFVRPRYFKMAKYP